MKMILSINLAVINPVLGVVTMLVSFFTRLPGKNAKNLLFHACKTAFMIFQVQSVSNGVLQSRY